MSGEETALHRGGGGRDRDCALFARGWQGQRLRSLGEGVAGAETNPSGRGWQGQRLRSLGEGVAGAGTTLPWGESGGGRDCAPLH